MVLLVIDVQKGITDERLYGFQQFEDNLKQLIDASRKNGVEEKIGVQSPSSTQ